MKKNSQMLGGGRERRESIGSLIENSPCVRVEKRKHSEGQNGQSRKLQITPMPSIASTSDSVKFGNERMIRAQHGHIDRQSLEESCLVADGEDSSFSCRFRTAPELLNTNHSHQSLSTQSSLGQWLGVLAQVHAPLQVLGWTLLHWPRPMDQSLMVPNLVSIYPTSTLSSQFRRIPYHWHIETELAPVPEVAAIFVDSPKLVQIGHLCTKPSTRKHPRLTENRPFQENAVR